MFRVILDTNILLSGLFFNGNERKILEMFLQEKIHLILPEHVVAEAKEVIQRKSIGFGKLSIKSEGLFELIANKAQIPKLSEYGHNFSKAKEIVRDRKDAPILAAVLSVEHDYFLSGDKDFIVLGLKTHISTKELLEKINA